MATKEAPKPAGLLSKVARFVANPTTDWNDLDRPPPKEEEEARDHDRQLLKAMIELKRKNDFVRHREFSSLRKLRQKNLGTLQSNDKVSERPSFFQSSFPTRSDDKLVTLKKINEIEAQMSMQWWSTKHAQSTLNPNTLNPNSVGPSSILNPPSQSPPASQSFQSSFPQSDKLDFPVSNPGVVTVTGNSILPIFEGRMFGPDSRPGFVNTQNAFGGPNSVMGQPSRLPSASIQAHEVPTDPMPLPEPLPRDALQLAPTTEPTPAKPGSDSAAESPSQMSGFSSSRGFAIEVEEVNHDPDLEEAAIRFANADYEGAEATLQEALQSKETGALNENAWLALFDLYRATDNQTAFESLAIDYAGYFQRSSPQWISFPSLIKDVNPSLQSDTSTAAHWKAPAAIGIQSVAALRAALTKAPQPWRLDWSRLVRIEDNALPQMIDLVRDWCDNADAHFRFACPESFVDLLMKATPPNHANVDQNWWHLRLETLRMFHRPDEFEIVALEYCITYEVSPPSWAPAKCTCKLTDAMGASQHSRLTVIQASKTEFSPDAVISAGMATTRLNDIPIIETAIELSGHLQGEPEEALAMLDDAVEGADRMVISCEKLIRVDFHAAGGLLNWVIARHHEGRQVHFTDLHRMILAFFHVIGISEHALTSVRQQ